jgi:UDP-glucose 4-epimerase
MMIRLYGLDLKPVHAPPRPGDIRDSYADITRAMRALGWNPRISLEDGLQKLIRGDDL